MTLRLKARRLPRQPGPAGWNRLLPPPPPALVLEGDATADVAIVGAGFAGLSAARRLIQLDPAIKVAILEAGRVADGPAGRNSGFMVDLPHNLASDHYSSDVAEADSLQTRLNRIAIRFAGEASEEYAMPSDAFDPCGKINAAATPEGDRRNRDYGAYLAAQGEDHRLMDAREMADLTGTDYFTSGLFTPGAAILQPAAYIRGLANGLSGAVAVYENSPVTEIAREGTGWRLTTPKGSVSAGKVILANNGHAESFGLFERRLLHIFTYASMTEPLPEGRLGGAPKWGATPADPMGTTVRRIVAADGGRIVVRTRFTYNPSMEVGDAGLRSAGNLHDRKFAERFPMLNGVGMEFRWAGHLCLSWNDVPVSGEVEPGLFSAVCQNGLGTTKGTLSGICAAELALGADSEVSRAMARMDPPRRLPPAPLTWLGASALLKWREWRARKE